MAFTELIKTPLNEVFLLQLNSYNVNNDFKTTSYGYIYYTKRIYL